MGVHFETCCQFDGAWSGPVHRLLLQEELRVRTHFQQTEVMPLSALRHANVMCRRTAYLIMIGCSCYTAVRATIDL